MTGADIARIERARTVASICVAGAISFILGLTLLLGAAGFMVGAGISIFVLSLVITIEGTK